MRRVRLAHRIDNGQAAVLIKWQQGRQGGVQAKLAVQVDGRFGIPGFRLRNGNGGAQFVIIGVAVGHHQV